MIRSGIDIIEIERVAAAVQRHQEKFLQRIYTTQELINSQGKPQSLAARFAAKEAVAKAIGSGIGKISWKDIEILSYENGQPYVNLRGYARDLSDQQGLSEWSISLSHSLQYAVAIAVAIG
ncbi:MAG: holo-ACP synthase [Anaerolineales bacterium]